MTSQNPGNSAKEILLERYEVQQQLGKKAGRRTLLTRDLQTQELVVIKLLSFDDDFQWDDLKLFEREAETLKAISHPAIPHYLDYFELDTPEYKGFALIQSYIPAESLETQIKAGRSFSESEVRELAKAILNILTYLHNRQPPVIHRDIKPSNILLTNRSGNSVGDVYLVDFGSVQTIVRSNSTMTVVGSYGYMPPEQFSGKATPASDLYGLGATLIYLITGQHPADLPQEDLIIKFEQAANVSPGFSNWLRKMTEPMLSRRLGSAEKALKSLIFSKKQIPISVKSANLYLGKPVGSKVILNKDDDFIEIIIPPARGFPIVLVMLKWYFLASISLSFTIAIVPLLHMMFAPIIAPLNFLILLLIISICLFGRKRIYINKRQISLSHELFSINRHQIRPSLRKNIIRLERTNIYHNNEPRPCLIIWAGMLKYEIFTGRDKAFAVTTIELDWLAEELSNWLDLPVIRE
ncbi:serine/threonine-protein kinase [Anabaena sp. UHCC 0204]|uniref:serine/threonine protein kinase n=1 Tax=Anabaena sp. UHCC 0204 TaxID=2590009 RepID=UPI0014469DB8|nr:serine/threonine-protein kinase [Anabaena sp. UHCC 0204]MTJ06660.1 serine/threonine protein kinase [Anabaena sp. UHCC 0204]